MSDKEYSERVDGLIIKEESDISFVADSTMMEKVKEEREDEMIEWKVEDDMTIKEESLDTDIENDSYPYEECEDPLLTLECRSCEEVCATRSDLETHTKNKHGSGKHPSSQKRKQLVESKGDRLHDHGRSSCDETLATTRPSPPPKKRQANFSYLKTLALADAVHGRRDVIDYSHMPQENHKNKQQAWGEGSIYGNGETKVARSMERSGDWKQLRVSAKKRISQERPCSLRTGSHSNQEDAVASEKEGGSPPFNSFEYIQDNSSLKSPGCTDESSDDDPPATQPCRASSTTEGMTINQERISASVVQLVQNQRLVVSLLSELVAGQKHLVASQKEMVAVARDGVNALQEALEMFKQ
ncbi:uncharacterized protein LOC119590585 [Penaeus monodon]|uniref:uncharacterized protein LOC119590585 n=1 Tax=Penaeus monodon TaxID=6687 RepID=UPI0018A7BAEA|nr:uncharacterized protein LOC119590585 [Penaeus monodon]